MYLNELIGQVQQAKIDLRSDLTDVEYDQINMQDPHKVANYLSLLEKENVDGIAIMAPESPQVRDAISRLSERDIKVVEFLSGQENLENPDFVGADNVAAGATAGKNS